MNQENQPSCCASIQLSWLHILSFHPPLAICISTNTCNALSSIPSDITWIALLIFSSSTCLCVTFRNLQILLLVSLLILQILHSNSMFRCLILTPILRTSLLSSTFQRPIKNFRIYLRPSLQLVLYHSIQPASLLGPFLTSVPGLLPILVHHRDPKRLCIISSILNLCDFR